MRAAVVIGAGFGDEGKGLMTDYLCHKAGADATAVRFNGGAQAGHTVETPAGLRHVFHHFGSGTLAKAGTYLGPEFIVNPVLFWQEFGELRDIGLIGCDPYAPVATPYDMILNQLAEEARGKDRHGSCGVGIGETVARTEAGFGLRMRDLDDERKLASKLGQIETAWYPRRVKELGLDSANAMAALRSMMGLRERFINDCRRLYSLRRMSITTDLPSTGLVFEGAQGLLLDQKQSRYFPHVTRSNTGLTNVLPLAQRWALEGLDVVYVTRAYLTRHGAGAMPNETKGQPYPWIEDKTNVPHPFQGTLRFGFLDLDVMAAAIKKDLEATGGWFPKITATIALTCVDHVDGPRRFGWFRRGNLQSGTFADFCDAIRAVTGLDVRYASRGPTRAHVREVMKYAPIRTLAQETA